jgi:hypothetical protein
MPFRQVQAKETIDELVGLAAKSRIALQLGGAAKQPVYFNSRIAVTILPVIYAHGPATFFHLFLFLSGSSLTSADLIHPTNPFLVLTIYHCWPPSL